MDGLRELGGDGFGMNAPDYISLDDDAIVEAPPPVVGQDERRLQVRAYNFWTGLLDGGPFPPVAPLLAGHLPDFADRSVLLHFDEGYEDPAIVQLGALLASECGDGAMPARLSDVPGRTLLSRITDHYMQIIANEAPIGFEAEFVNQDSRNILYRGILLPFSSDGEKIDYIYGVINWKELADQQTTDDLLLQIGQALAAVPAQRPSGMGMLDALNAAEPADRAGVWADGPRALAYGADEEELDLAAIGAEILPFPGSMDEDEAGNLPMPGFGANGVPGDDDIMDLAGLEEVLSDLDEAVLAPSTPINDDFGLADWLASARELAHAAHTSEDRTRGALYAAIGRAWDFALATRDAPEDYADMIADAGLSMQARAPLIPLVKLVFGAEYDKTRLTEYATVLGHAERIGLQRGELGGFLASAPGGLKGVVSTERRLRREESGKARVPDAAEVLAQGLRALPARPLADLPAEGPEFALVMVRRQGDGTVALLGDVTGDQPLFERAARRLVG